MRFLSTPMLRFSALLVVALGSGLVTWAQEPTRAQPNDNAPAESADELPAPAAHEEEESTADNPAPAGFIGLLVENAVPTGSGVRVVDMHRGGPAESSGLRMGDVIKQIQGNPVETVQDFGDIAKLARPSEVLELGVATRTGLKIVQVHVGTRPAQPDPGLPEFGFSTLPEAEPAPPPRAYLGIIAALTANAGGDPAGIGAMSGAVVQRIEPGSPAEKAGVPLNAAIIRANDEPIRSPRDLALIVKNMRPGEKVDLMYWYRGQLAISQVTLSAGPPTDLSAGEPASTTVTRPSGPSGLSGSAGPSGLGGSSSTSAPGGAPLRGNPPTPNAASGSTRNAGSLPADAVLERMNRLEERLERLERLLTDLLEQQSAPASERP